MTNANPSPRIPFILSREGPVKTVPQRKRGNRPYCHCEERSDVAISPPCLPSLHYLIEIATLRSQ